MFYERYELKRRHPYRFLDTKTGEIIKPVGCTTVTGLLGKDAIPQWAANLAARYAIDNSQMDGDELYEQARKAHIRARDDAAEGGTAAHAWIEAYLKGELEDEYYFETEAALNIVEAYLKFETDYPFTNHKPETILFSKEYKFAGTRDDLAWNNEFVFWTHDFKTGNPDFEYDPKTKTYTGRVKAYDAHFLQCAGYDIASSEMDGLISEGYRVIYLLKDPKAVSKKYNVPERPYYVFETTNTPYWRQHFLGLRELYELSKNNPYREVK